MKEIAQVPMRFSELMMNDEAQRYMQIEGNWIMMRYNDPYNSNTPRIRQGSLQEILVFISTKHTSPMISRILRNADFYVTEFDHNVILNNKILGLDKGDE